MRALPGVFISIEGVEGVGKSTAVHFMEQYLNDLQLAYLMTREPGGTAIAEKIRAILLAVDENEKLVPDVELLLMFASRAQHVAHVIQPALQAGKWVVSDRFVDASFAYQGNGRGLSLEKIQTLSEWVVGSTLPQATILLDAPPAIGLARAKHRGPQDRIEQEHIDFFERVRAGYLARAAADPKRFHIIDATRSIEVVHADIKQVLDQLYEGQYRAS